MRSTLTVTYETQCAMCEAKAVETKTFALGTKLWQPTVPKEWFTLSPAVVLCPEHRIVIAVDGEVVVDQ